MIEITSVTGILLQIQGTKSTKELWDAVKEETINHIHKHGGFPAIFDMPCGSRMEFKGANAIRVLEIKDLPCPCGDKTHWLIRFKSTV